MVLEQLLIGQVHLFGGGGGAIISLAKFSEGVVIILGREQLATLNAKGLGDTQRFVRHPFIEAEDAVELRRRQKVP